MISVLIDLSWLAYRALHTMGGLEFEDIPTGIIFGVFNQIRHICMDPRVRSNRVAIFCDSGTSIRARSYPQYKSKRHQDRTPEQVAQVSAMKEQRIRLQTRILPDIGFPIYSQEGMESDDLMACIANSISYYASSHTSGYSVNQKRAVMITSDSDLFQCISPWVHWFDPQRNVYHDAVSFLNKTGIDPDMWGRVKSLSGCSSDNVAGIRGVGEQTAIKYLKGELPATRQTHRKILSPEGQRTLKVNRDLVVLPHRATRPITLRDPEYRIETFFAYCKEFGFHSILDEQKSWEMFFRGSPFKTRKRGEK